MYDVERGPDGVMKITPPPVRMPTAKELHDRRCFLLGIDPEKWGRLWAKEQARMVALRDEATADKRVHQRKREKG